MIIAYNRYFRGVNHEIYHFCLCFFNSSPFTPPFTSPPPPPPPPPCQCTTSAIHPPYGCTWGIICLETLGEQGLMIDTPPPNLHPLSLFSRDGAKKT